MIDALTNPLVASALLTGVFLVSALFWAFHEEEKDKSKTDKND